MEKGWRGTHLDIYGALLVAVAVEGVRVIFRGLPLALSNGDALPPELLDRDKRLVQMRIFGDEVRPEVHRESLRNENVRRCLRDVCEAQ